MRLIFNPKNTWLQHKSMLLRFHISVVAGALRKCLRVPIQQSRIGASAGISLRAPWTSVGSGYALFSDTFCLEDASASRPDPPPTTSVELLRVHSSLSQKSIRHGEVPGLTKILHRAPGNRQNRLHCLLLPRRSNRIERVGDSHHSPLVFHSPSDSGKVLVPAFRPRSVCLSAVNRRDAAPRRIKFVA